MILTYPGNELIFVGVISIDGKSIAEFKVEFSSTFPLMIFDLKFSPLLLKFNVTNWLIFKRFYECAQILIDPNSRDIINYSGMEIHTW